MSTNEKTMAALVKIRKFEDIVPKEDWKLGWSWQDVGVYPGTLGTLIVQGLVDMTYKSHSFTHYMLSEKGKLLAEAGDLVVEPQEIGLPEIPVDLFDDIIGYDNVKTLIRTSLTLEKPVHVLLYGPPALAKTMFLRIVEQLGGGLALWITGSATSQAGLWDLLAERKPRWLLVDEIEKMNLVDTSGLLSLMESGRLVRTKVGRTLDEQLTVWVIAAANRISGLSPELLSRFARVELQEYTSPEFLEVVKRVLVKWEDVDELAASQISHSLVGITHDIRDAIRVARLSTRIGVDKAVELLLKV